MYYGVVSLAFDLLTENPNRPSNVDLAFARYLGMLGIVPRSDRLAHCTE